MYFYKHFSTIFLNIQVTNWVREILVTFENQLSYVSIINSEKTYLLGKRGQSISTETVMQCTEEHVECASMGLAINISHAQ
jgi:hypothetical protein